jgi:hypothetical protein
MYFLYVVSEDFKSEEFRPNTFKFNSCKFRTELKMIPSSLFLRFPFLAKIKVLYTSSN